MKRISYLTAGLFVSAIATSAHAVELTSNGGFEAGSTAGWTTFLSGTQTFNLTNDAASGTFAAELFNNVPATPAVVKQANLGVGVVNPGEQVTISFKAKGEGAIGGVAFAEFFSEISGGGVSSSILLGGAPLALTNQYQTFNYVVNAGPDVSGGVTLQLAAVTGANSGSVSVLFIDDASVSVVPEPMGAALLGVAAMTAIRRRRI